MSEFKFNDYLLESTGGLSLGVDRPGVNKGGLILPGVQGY